MSMNPGVTYYVRRCEVCAINYFPSDEFATCERCGEDTEPKRIAKHYAADRAPTLSESRSGVAQMRAQRARENEIDRERRERDLAPVISAATAALRLDLDQWATAAGAAELDRWIEDIG
jgi:hypothetical protein